jgi:hypothetical protein
MDELESSLDSITYNKIYCFIIEKYNYKYHHKKTIMVIDYIYLLHEDLFIFE